MSSGFSLMGSGLHHIPGHPPSVPWHTWSTLELVAKSQAEPVEPIVGSHAESVAKAAHTVGICAHIGPPASTRSTAGHVHGRSAKRSKLMLPKEMTINMCKVQMCTTPRASVQMGVIIKTSKTTKQGLLRLYVAPPRGPDLSTNWPTRRAAGAPRGMCMVGVQKVQIDATKGNDHQHVQSADVHHPARERADGGHHKD